MRVGTTPVQGGQRSRSQGESRDHPLVARGGEPSLSLPSYPTHPQALMWPAGVPRAPQGPRRQVPGNCGLNQGGEGHYAIPGAPARIEAMPWARAGFVVRWAWAQPCAWHHLTCRRSKVPESPGPCPGTIRVGPSPTALPPSQRSPCLLSPELCLPGDD